VMPRVRASISRPMSAAATIATETQVPRNTVGPDGRRSQTPGGRRNEAQKTGRRNDRRTEAAEHRSGGQLQADCCDVGQGLVEVSHCRAIALQAANSVVTPAARGDKRREPQFIR